MSEAAGWDWSEDERAETSKKEDRDDATSLL